ncbi:Phenyllactate dehydrogenase [Methyloligella halotolerans]|uniref:Phenyllactate dehydrogenase n=1 Tax=Methyloligella halotolerans TaxID=1177755 RepID=A0A1E2S2E2_9HYPH|nr:NAD(P)-dependent oxidoreductase [Methyloligella halotolerans]ODA68676.1 Phenyllactate dehydrogenase [Methyloligella halotolerans]
MPKALLSCLHLQRNFNDFRHIYDEAGVEPVLPDVPGQQLAADEMRRHIAGVDCVIAGDDEIDAAVLDAGKASGLKAVIKWGIGTDSIDKAHAARIGIPVFNTPGVFANEVADLGLSLFLNLTRGTHLMHNSVAEGGWRKIEGRSLTGMTAGVLGLGSIGLAIADRARAFGMHPVGFDVRQLSDEELGRHAIEQLPFDDVLARADVIFVACNLTPENRHMLSREPRQDAARRLCGECRPRTSDRRGRAGRCAPIGPYRRGRAGCLRAGASPGRQPPAKVRKLRVFHP